MAVPRSAYSRTSRQRQAACSHVTVESPRCPHCGRKLAAKLTTPYSLRCPKCREDVEVG